jgi:hypothetical protein
MGAPLAPITTTPWLEDDVATQVMTTVPSRVMAPRPDTGLPFKHRRASWEGQRAQAYVQ